MDRQPTPTESRDAALEDLKKRPVLTALIVLEDLEVAQSAAVEDLNGCGRVSECTIIRTQWARERTSAWLLRIGSYWSP